METPPIYFNSTGLSGYQLETAIRKATKQNDRVMLIYKAKNRPMSPMRYILWILTRHGSTGGPLTSIGSIAALITNLSATEDRQGNPIIPTSISPTPRNTQTGAVRGERGGMGTNRFFK